MPVEHLIALPVIIFLASLLQSLSGFGFSMIAMPMATLFLPAKVVAPILVVLCLMLNSTIVYKVRKHFDVRSIWPLLLTGIIFTPVGTWALIVLDELVLRLFIGVLIVVVSILLMVGLRVKIENEKPWFASLGVISGLLNGSMTLAGPPVIVFLTNQSEDKHSFRARLTGYFLLLGIFTFGNYAVTGLMLTRNVGIYCALTTIPMFIGTFTGIRLADKVSEKAFKKLVLWVILSSGILSLLFSVNALSSQDLLGMSFR
jgi:uncharacterized protein